MKGAFLFPHIPFLDIHIFNNLNFWNIVSISLPTVEVKNIHSIVSCQWSRLLGVFCHLGGYEESPCPGAVTHVRGHREYFVIIHCHDSNRANIWSEGQQTFSYSVLIRTVEKKILYGSILILYGKKFWAFFFCHWWLSLKLILFSIDNAWQLAMTGLIQFSEMLDLCKCTFWIFTLHKFF